MYKDKSFIAIIPARSGSKGLPDKNIKELNSKPLIAWTIESALSCKYIDEVMVTTDSQEYASISKNYGANVPFIRPKELASDTASRREFIQHTLKYYMKNGKEFDYIILLEPTSPLRTYNDLNVAIEKLVNNKSGAEAIVGVCELESTHPSFLIKLQDSFLKFLDSKQQSEVLRRQDLEKFYFYEGSLYISEVNSYLEKEFYHDKTLGYVVPKWKSLEIDELEDLVMVEAIMKHKRYT
tara:strand:- start:363 stop:1076 length:714 start_codon:yes stop_codon:yes gene_type:complete